MIGCVNTRAIRDSMHVSVCGRYYGGDLTFIKVMSAFMITKHAREAEYNLSLNMVDTEIRYIIEFK